MASAAGEGCRLFRNDREEEKGCPWYEKAAHMQKMDNRQHESSWVGSERVVRGALCCNSVKTNQAECGSRERVL